jgi:hypothetical protein
MSDVAIVIPSAGRADKVLTKIAGAILFVPESEAAAYAENHPGAQIEAHADGAFANLAAKRQHIYSRWGSCFQVDDDIHHVRRVYIEEDPYKHQMTPDEINELIQTTAYAARMAGCYLYGFNSSPVPAHYLPTKPIDMTAYINASAFGMHPSPSLYFTERTTAAESHWINLLNAYAHRKAWVDMRFHFRQAEGSTFTRPGGQTRHRTMDSERADTLFLRRMFGQAVQTKINRRQALKLHPYQRTIRNPL